MTARVAIALSLAVLLSGCRSELVGMKLGGPATAALAQERYGADRLPDKTMGDRILAAMALERVTGRKPDPRRFLD